MARASHRLKRTKSHWRLHNIEAKEFIPTATTWGQINTRNCHRGWLHRLPRVKWCQVVMMPWRNLWHRHRENNVHSTLNRPTILEVARCRTSGQHRTPMARVNSPSERKQPRPLQPKTKHTNKSKSRGLTHLHHQHQRVAWGLSECGRAGM